MKYHNIMKYGPMNKPIKESIASLKNWQGHKGRI